MTPHVAFCQRCRSPMGMDDVSLVVTRHGRAGIRGQCGTCGRGMFRFASPEETAALRAQTPATTAAADGTGDRPAEGVRVVTLPRYGSLSPELRQIAEMLGMPLGELNTIIRAIDRDFSAGGPQEQQQRKAA